MIKKQIELSRRKLLGAFGAAGLTSAGTGMGITALFSDTEGFENNSFMAGTLDLKIDWREYYD